MAIVNRYRKAEIGKEKEREGNMKTHNIISEHN